MLFGAKSSLSMFFFQLLFLFLLLALIPIDVSAQPNTECSNDGSEEFSPDSSPCCQPSCEDPEAKNPCTLKDCRTGPGCVCAKGRVRDGQQENRCVPREQCGNVTIKPIDALFPTPKCPMPHQEFRQIGCSCFVDTCQQRESFQCDCVGSLAQCVCSPFGFLWDERSGQCVPEGKCSPPNIHPKFGHEGNMGVITAIGK